MREDTQGERIAGVLEKWFSEFDRLSIELLGEFTCGENPIRFELGTG